MSGLNNADVLPLRLTEEVMHESVEARTEGLSSLRELGPPDLVHLVKQAPRNPAKQVCTPLGCGESSSHVLTMGVVGDLSPCYGSGCVVIGESGGVY